MPPSPHDSAEKYEQRALTAAVCLAVCAFIVAASVPTLARHAFAQTPGGFTALASDVGAREQTLPDRPFDWSAVDAPTAGTPHVASAGRPYQLLHPHVSTTSPGTAHGPYTNAPVPSLYAGGMDRLLEEFQAPSPEVVRSRPRPGAWSWQLLPDGLIYRSYLAGVREPRFAGVWNYERDLGWIWDIALGGRAGIIRYGTRNDFQPEGWQLDIEGAAFPRLDLEEERDVVATDFRFGVPLTYGVGRFQTKFAFYHLSSHLGDEFMLKNPTVSRINFSRDVFVLGFGWFFTPELRGYFEAGYAFKSDVSLEWEFQFGFDYAPCCPTGFRGAPFAAVNAHLREEVDFGGNFVVQLGWAWRGAGAGHLFRIGAQYFNGMSEQYEFITDSESKVGLGIWYDY